MGLHLRDLAKQVGISASALSQIENAKAFPSIFSLKAIADSLHTTVGEIIGENETLSKKPVVRSTERKFVKENESGTQLFLLSHHDPLKKMETYAMVIPENSDTTDIMVEHPGQEFIFIVMGAVHMLLDNKNYELYQGDGFYFNSAVSHQIRNVNKGSSELIWVIAS